MAGKSKRLKLQLSPAEVQHLERLRGSRDGSGSGGAEG